MGYPNAHLAASPLTVRESPQTHPLIVTQLIIHPPCHGDRPGGGQSDWHSVSQPLEDGSALAVVIGAGAAEPERIGSGPRCAGWAYCVRANNYCGVAIVSDGNLPGPLRIQITQATFEDHKRSWRPPFYPFDRKAPSAYNRPWDNSAVGCHDAEYARIAGVTLAHEVLTEGT
jgi:hypothetical protein